MTVPLFQQLLEYKWRGVAFPTSEFSVTLAQDNAHHAAWKRQGENLEATGRKSLEFRATIPFRNGIVPASVETWPVLYPGQYRLFLDAMALPTTGILTHPELGDIECKPGTCETKWLATKRDGCDVDATWTESIDLNVDDSLTIGSQSPVNEIELSALSLDVDYPNIRQLAPGLPKRTESLMDILNAFVAYGDQAKLFAARQAGMLARADYAAGQILRTIDLADNPLLAQQKSAAIRMRNAIADLKKDLAQLGGRITYYRVPAPTTIAGIATAKKIALGDIISMNPTLVAKPVVPAGTTVRYRSAA